MLQKCVAHGLSCASRGALRRCTVVSTRLSMKSRHLFISQCNLSAQVSVAETDSTRETSTKVTKIADEILDLNLLEVSDLSSILKDRLGLDALPMAGAMPMAVATPATGAPAEAEAAPVAEQKTKFNIKIESFDASSKIKVLKEVRSFTDLGLKEAKETVEKAPVVVKEDVEKGEAEEIKKKLEEVGAVVILE